MGCDIHMAVEMLEVRQWKMVIGVDGAYSNRNYSVFSVLAGVRNFDNITPIDIPRGLPEDVSKEAAADVRLGADHSFSWLTLEETEKYPWDSNIKRSGIVNFIEAARFLRDGKPKGWARGVGGVNIVTLEEMKNLLKEHPVSDEMLTAHSTYFPPQGHPLSSYYCDAEWDEKMSGACADFLKWVQSLKATSLGFALKSSVRLVFGFDN